MCSNPSTLQPAVGWMSRVGFLAISPLQDSRLWGGGRLPLGLGKWLNFYKGKGWWEGRVPIRGIRGERALHPQGDVLSGPTLMLAFLSQGDISGAASGGEPAPLQHPGPPPPSATLCWATLR